MTAPASDGSDVAGIAMYTVLITCIHRKGNDTMKPHTMFTYFIAMALAVLVTATVTFAGPPQNDNSLAALAKVNHNLKLAQVELSEQTIQVKKAANTLTEIKDSFGKTKNKAVAKKALRLLKSDVSQIAADHKDTVAFIDATESLLKRIAAGVHPPIAPAIKKMFDAAFNLVKETQRQADAVEKSIVRLQNDMSAFADRVR